MERSFPRSIESLQKIFTFMEECAAFYTLPEDIAPSIDLAVEELFTNMVKYQHPGGAEIRINCTRLDGAFQIQMTDHDVDRFDPTSLPDPDLTLPIEHRRPGGLGIFLTKRLMDDLRYEYRERTSIITVTKNFRRNDD